MPPPLRVLFFGRLREIAGAQELQCDAELADVAALRDWLSARNPELGEALRAPGVRVAREQSFCSFDEPLSGAREIAFMSPLSGG